MLCALQAQSQFKKLSIHLALVIGVGCVSLTGFATCPDDFRQIAQAVRPKTGDPVQLPGFERDTVTKLGEGKAGGSVYLITPADGSAPYVLKDYHFWGPASANNDRIGLDMLGKLLKPEPGKPQELRAIRFIDFYDPQRLELEYVAGQDLAALSTNLTPTQFAQLRVEYVRRLRMLESKFKQSPGPSFPPHTYQVVKVRYPRIENPNSLPSIELRLMSPDPHAQPGTVMITITPQNVILTKDGEFVIIDPN